MPVLLRASFDDGRPVSPTAPLVLDFSAPLDPETVHERSVLLVRGSVDDDQRRAFDRGTPTAVDRQREAPLGITFAGARVVLAFARPLVGATRYSLVLTTAIRAAGRRLGDTLVRGLRTSSASEGAPSIDLLSPDAGATGVVRNLREVAVRFNRSVSGADEGSLLLVDDSGEGIAARVVPDGPASHDFRLLPLAPLRPLRRYHVEATGAVRAADGQAPFVSQPPPGFTVGLELRDAPPEFVGVEVASSSGCVVARFATRRPAVSRLCIESECTERSALRGVHQLEQVLPPGGSPRFSIEARDESTAPEAWLGPLPVPRSSSRTLRVTELLARAHSGVLADQFVEIQNVGDASVSTEGIELRDERGATALPPAILAPRAFALIVPRGFAPAPGGDAQPLEGTVMLRVGANHLAGNGLKLSGEAIELREADGTTVSRFSTVGLVMVAGQSARRVAPCDRDGAFEPTPGGGSTPGGP